MNHIWEKQPLLTTAAPLDHLSVGSTLLYQSFLHTESDVLSSESTHLPLLYLASPTKQPQQPI